VANARNDVYFVLCFFFAEPNFVGSYDIGQYVFFFFRETAVEYINCGKSVYSRVARVCKKDTGGKNILSQNWATYLKARLNCSIPGEFPFYFNEIRKLFGKYLQSGMLVGRFIYMCLVHEQVIPQSAVMLWEYGIQLQ
jgi:hypothetical protein